MDLPEDRKRAIVMHDSDTKFTQQFRAILKSEGLRPKRVGPAAPNLNAFVERFVQTLQQECLDHFVVLGERHLNPRGVIQSTCDCGDGSNTPFLRANHSTRDTCASFRDLQSRVPIAFEHAGSAPKHIARPKIGSPSFLYREIATVSSAPAFGRL